MESAAFNLRIVGFESGENVDNDPKTVRQKFGKKKRDTGLQTQ